MELDKRYTNQILRVCKWQSAPGLKKGKKHHFTCDLSGQKALSEVAEHRVIECQKTAQETFGIALGRVLALSSNQRSWQIWRNHLREKSKAKKIFESPLQGWGKSPPPVLLNLSQRESESSYEMSRTTSKSQMNVTWGILQSCSSRDVILIRDR